MNDKCICILYMCIDIFYIVLNLCSSVCFYFHLLGGLSIYHHFQHTLQVPPQLNMPKSYLQFFSEPIYSYSDGHDLLSRCADAPGTSSDRFLRVVAWHLSTIRLGPFCQAPLNPILGETHHVSSGSLNVIAEQVSCLDICIANL